MSQLNISSTSPYVKIKPATSDPLGKGVFATKDFEVGETVIAVERPLIVALDQERLNDTCYECYRQVGSYFVELTLGFEPCPIIRKDGDDGEIRLKACAGCKTVRYCGKACQKASWHAHHAMECSIYKAMYPRILPNHMRAVLRLLLLDNTGRIKPEDWKAFMDCSANKQAHNQDDQKAKKEDFQRSALIIANLTPFEQDPEEVLEILMRMKINSLTLQPALHDPLGLAMHPLLAKVNHSCRANCYYRFPEPNPLPRNAVGANPGSIVLSPLRKIHAGEEITMAYVDPNMPLRYRQDQLQERYFFTCTCVKCKEQQDEQAQLNPVVRERISYAEDRARRVLSMGEQAVSGSATEDRIKALSKEVGALFESDADWPIDKYPFPSLLDRLRLAYIDIEDYYASFRLTTLLVLRVDMLVHKNNEFHPAKLARRIALVKMLQAIFDPMPLRNSSTARSIESQKQDLSAEIDLEFWMLELAQASINMGKESRSEQPWLWMWETMHQRRQAHPDYSIQVDQQQHDKMFAMCDRTMDKLKSGTRISPGN